MSTIYNPTVYIFMKNSEKLPVYKQELINRLVTAHHKCGKTKREVAEEVGVSYNTIMKWFRVGSIARDNMAKLAKSLNVDEAWLLSGAETTEVRGFDGDDATERDVMIAVYDIRLSAGDGAIMPEYIKTKNKLPFDRNWLQKHKLKPKYLKVLAVAGDSMMPTMEDGDSVLIDTSKTNIVDRKIYAVIIGGECKIKRLTQKFDGSVIVSSDNPIHPTETIAPEDLEHLYIIGQAVYRSGMI